MNLVRHILSHPLYRRAMERLQRQHRRQIRALLNDLWIDANATIFDLALDEPEKLIALGQRLAEMERDKGKPGQKLLIPEGIPTFAVAIACERSGLIYEVFVSEAGRIVAPWDNGTITISLSTLKRAINKYQKGYLSDEDMTEARAMADEIIRRIKALPNSLI